MASKLLLVEDKALIAFNETRIIKKHGYEVKTVYTGEEAIEAVDADPDIALILMDIDLGEGMDGTEAAQAILARHELPIVFLTGHSEKEYVERVKKITGYGYVLKDAGEFVLIESINMAFNLFKAHRRLQEKEREYRDVVDHIDSAILRLNKEGLITFFSRGAEKIFGYSAEEVEGRSELGLIIPEQDGYDENLNRMYEDLLSNPDTYSYHVNENICKDGTRLWMAWKNKKIFDEEGNFLYIQSIANDITEQKRAEEALRRSEYRLKRTQEIANIGSWELDLRKNELSWSDEIYRIFGLTPQEFGATYEAFLESVHPEDREAVDHAYTSSIQQGGDEYEIEHRIVRRDTGEIRYVHEKCEHLRDEHGTIVRSLGMVQDITSRKKAEIALKEREENLRITLNSIGDAVVSTDMEGRIVHMNPVAEELSGWLLESARGKKLKDILTFLNADTRKAVKNPVQKVIENGAAIGLANNTCLISADGTEYTIADSAAPIEDEEGNISGVVMVFRDVSEEYEKDRQLQHSERQYRTLVESSPIGIFQSHSEGYFVHVNSYMARILGGEGPREILRHYRDLATQLYVQPRRREEFVRQLRREGHLRNFEFEAIRVDGSRCWLFLNARLSKYNEDGSFIIDGFAFDITARRKAEERSEEQRFLLQRYQDRLEATMQVGLLAWWEMDIESGRVLFNEQKARMLGFDPSEFTTYHDFTALLHPQDYEPTMQAMRDHLEGTSSSYSIDYRLRTKQGDYIWFHDTGGITSRDENGRPQKVTGVVINIEKRKKVEQQYKQLVDEKNFLMKELNHRVKNNLAMISSLLSLKDSILGNEIDLSDIKSQIDAIRIVHEKLFQSEDITHIAVRDYFQELLDTIFTSFSTRQVTVENRIEELSIETKPAISLALIINEVATNAIKHGFTEDEAPRFSIEMYKDAAAQQYVLRLSNNGNPFPEEVTPEEAETLGLQLIRSLIEQLEGEMELTKTPSPQFTFTFPVQQ